MDIHILTQFKKTAELQHITRAAEALHVAQPSLSRTIAALETELGVRLFDRVGKNIVLNDYGRIVLRRTDRILREMEGIRQEIADVQAERARTVSISMYAASKLLPQLVRSFKLKYPSIILHIVQDDLNQSKGDSDLSIFSSMLPQNEGNVVTLIEEDIFLALPETNPLARQASVDLRDFSGEEFICLQRGKSLRTITDAFCQMAGFQPNVILESDNPDTVRELIDAGIGISFVPLVTWSGIKTDNIVLVPISFPTCKRYINLAWREGGYLSSAAVLFRDYVQEYFRELSGTV